MWTKVSSPHERDALVQDYLARRDRLRQRFVSERLGEELLQTEATKLFKPITSEAIKQAIAQTEELAKITSALESAQIDRTVREEPRALLAKAKEATLIVDPDKDLDTKLIRLHGFTPPSELNISDQSGTSKIIEDITHYNRHTLGAEKRAADTQEEKKTLTADIKALAAYRDRLHLLPRGQQLTEKHLGTGLQLKLRGNQFGNLTIDPASLAAGRVQAFHGGSLVLEAPADGTLHSLLTKRFVKMKQYTPQAVETFKQLVELSGLPVHGRKSKKHQLIRGGAVYYDDPNVLVERLQLLVASKQAGNTGLDNKISAILDELMRCGAVPKDQALQLNRALLL
jgi:hypothetical protein